MKISPRHLYLCAAATISFALTSAVFAQDSKPRGLEPASAEPMAGRPTAEKSPAISSPVEEPAAPAAAPAPTEPATAEPAAGMPASAESISVQPAADRPATVDETKDEPAEQPKMRRLDTNDEDAVPPKSRKERIHERVERAHVRAAAARAKRVNRDIVNIFSDSHQAKDEKVDNVVAVFGSSTAEGEVTDSVVSVFGNSHASGPVGDAVVSVLGDSEVAGPVGDSVVVVLGDLSINSHVKGDVVTVLGDIKFGPAAEVDGDVVCVGGTVTKAAGTILHHSPRQVGIGFMHGGAELKAWVHQCFMYGRPLAFGPNLMWAWWIALGCLAFYVVLALIFGKGINKCVDTFQQRPGYSILTALLTVVLAPIVIIVLTITGVGIAVIPFLAAALFFASLFGKAVMLAWIGRWVGKLLGTDHPALAVLFGGVIVLLLYTIPVVGFITYKLLGWVGLGVVVYTLIGAIKRERPVVPPTPPLVPASTGAVDPVTGAVLLTPGLAAPAGLMPPITAMTLPRAGFWIRLAALLLDVIIVAIICSLLSGFFPFGSHVRIKADLLPSLALYGALMWKLRGTTVGGIVCGLKVVRLDDRPLDWGTAIVRALGCFLSLFVMGLGFIWVAFDDQRQSWHDKIAGTTVVRVPKGVSLV